MEEERLVEEQVENIDIAETGETVIPVIDETITLSSQNETVGASVEETEVFNVTISEDVGPHALKIVSDHGFDLPRQHSIGAIEGLREELDEIERLKTVYSDSKNQANYYMWQDENPNQENRDSYFVSVYQTDGINRISICDSSKDEFGVTVGAAGFVGNQNSETSRSSNYGLVVHSGVVAVRCENDVKAEDYVVSNKYGQAKKTDGTYGYLVNSISTIDGTEYAIISLTTNSKPLQKVSEVAYDVAERMKNAEYNIFVNRGVANDAYAAAKDALAQVANNNTQVGDKLGEIIDKVDSTVGRVDDLEIGVGQAQNSATNAESIATSLGNQAVNASAEAVVQANAARQEAENARDEIYAVRDQAKIDTDKALSQAQKANEDISTLVQEMEPLSQWTDGVNTGISGFIAKSDEHSTQLALISKWQTETTDNIAGIQTQANTNSASIKSLTSYVDKSCEVIDTWSELNKDEGMVYYAKDEKFYYYYDAGTKKWKYSETPSGAGLTESIAYVTQLADANSSAIEQTASHIGKTYTTIKEWPDNAENLDTTRVYYVEDNKKYYYYEEVKDENDVKKNVWVSKDTAPITHLSTSIATVEQKADDNSAQIQQIVANESETATTIAEIKAKADKNETEITNLTSYINRSYIELDSWPDDISTLKTDEIYFVDAHVTYETREKYDTADWDTTKVYYAEDTKKYYCYKEGAWVSQDTAPDGTEIPAYYYYYQDPEWRTTIDPADAGLIASIANVTQKANANEASIQGLTEWQGETNGSIATLTQKADADGAVIEGLVSNVNKYSVGEYSQANGLTHDEAKNILKSGTVFIPTSEHDEKYSEDYIQEFSKGFYYTWNGVKWVESDSGGQTVLSDTYINGSVSTPYWVVGDTYCVPITEWNETDKDIYKMYCVIGNDKHYYYYENDDWIKVYEPRYKVGALYKWENDQWIEVMTRESNMLSRSTSLIQQKANEITLSVTNVEGSLALLQTKVEKDGAATTMMLASVVTEFKDTSGNPVSITGSPYQKVEDITNPADGKYYAVGSQAPYDIYTIKDDVLTKVNYLYYDGIEIKQPNTASIVAAVNNEGDSSIGINADKIIMTGTTTFLRPFDVGPNGSTTIDGSRITTGTIVSNDKTVKIDLGEGTACVSGKIQATSGYIGNETNGFTIAKGDKYYYLSNDQGNYIGSYETNDEGVSGTPGVYVGPDGIGLGNGNFYVDNKGDITMKGNIVLSGSITWSTDSNPLKVLYSQTSGQPKDSDWKIANGEVQGNTQWHITWDEEKDKYAAYSYDGGQTWDSAIKIKGEDGDSYVGISEEDVFNMLTDGGGTQGIFPFYTDDEESVSQANIFINASYIKGGTLSGVTVESVNSNNNKIQLNDSRIRFQLPDYDENGDLTSYLTKLDMGFYDFNGYEQDGGVWPCIAIGAGTKSNPNSPINYGGGFIYKTNDSLCIGLSCEWSNEPIMYFTANDNESVINFGNSNVNFGTQSLSEDIYINFGTSKVDFSNCDSVDFGSNLTAPAVFG